MVAITVSLFLLLVLCKLENYIQKINYEQEIENLSARLEFKEGVIISLRNLNDNKHNYSEDIKSAVFYAMKKAHPDNGGRKDEFVKFRNLYEKME